MDKYLIVIAGPTASGKTALAIELAKYFNAEIISADARQFFKEMNIGTAKPSEEELSAVKHHFINSHSIQDAYSVGDYEKDVISLLADYYKEKNIAILAGGSGLYIRAICEGVDKYPEVPEEIRAELQESYQQYGIEILQKELEKCDPDYFKKVDIQNPHRLIRAIEVFRASGKPFSSFQKNDKIKRPFQIIKIGLSWEREKLYERINLRVDQMIENGLEEEARSLFGLKHLNALQTVGYQELFSFFENKISREEAISLIKQNTRNYAKRQMTWFRKESEMIWIDMPSDIKELYSYLVKTIKQDNIL
jgi:tRNA dimethylallyltransferase